mmetsp:Transcript_94813/g.171208  ORF Transcript_94813/g.171208 Transcript_94813/m.171208 type:complete len:173 (-) Transcript_94813:72-590(-)
MQLQELKDIKAAGGFEGLALHAITAEKGGDEEIAARLAIRGLVDLGFPVHSDPDHKLLLRLKSDTEQAAPMYMLKAMEASSMDSKTSIPYEDYEMVQPALVVLDKTGAVQQPTWSWLTTPIKDVEPKGPFTEVPGLGIMVAVRPVSSDIAPAVREARAVELHSVIPAKTAKI